MNETASSIQQHRSVQGHGPASLSSGIVAPGGIRGVALHRRDVDVIGYPIPLQDGQYLIVEEFGRRRFHRDAQPQVFALGRIHQRASALKALAAHRPTQLESGLAAIRDKTDRSHP